jgi:hypothetical protein
VKKLDFTETWERTDDKPVMFMHHYPIGENVEVIRVQGRSLQCRCAE